MVFRKNARDSYLGLLLLLWLLVNAAVRTVLLVMAHRSLDASFAPGTLAVLYFKGALNDLFPYFLLTLPLAALIFLKKNVFGGRVGRTLASLAFWLYACLFLFSAVAETLFWGEFSSRFNFIAVDYLIYTTEVIRNIRESYPVIPLLSAVAACAAVLTVPAMLLLWKKAARPAQRSPALFAGCLAMACATFFYAPLSSPDRVERELAANGVWSLFPPTGTTPSITANSTPSWMRKRPPFSCAGKRAERTFLKRRESCATLPPPGLHGIPTSCRSRWRVSEAIFWERTHRT